MTTKKLKTCALCAVALAASTAGAMPVGVRLAMMGRAAALAVQDVDFPELSQDASPDQVADALDGASDHALAENITNATDYADFRAWASSVGPATVKTSGTAWLSYALGTVALVPVPQDGDLAIDDVSVGTDGKLEAVVSLEGVTISPAALEARLKTVLGVEGSTELDEATFSSDNVGLTLVPTGDGRVRATVTPPVHAGDTYFMRMKVK